MPRSERPRRVALFSGHMIDAPGRKTPRFPPDKEAVAASAIAGALDELGLAAGRPCDLRRACGGDLLFAEAALARAASLELYIPFDEATFLKESVDFAGADWRARYFAAKARATLHVMPDELGPDRAKAQTLTSATISGCSTPRRGSARKRPRSSVLWNGERGDGPGGAKHMMDIVQEKGGRAIWLDTRKLWTV